jgi:hypothetical protein
LSGFFVTLTASRSLIVASRVANDVSRAAAVVSRRRKSRSDVDNRSCSGKSCDEDADARSSVRGGVACDATLRRGDGVRRRGSTAAGVSNAADEHDDEEADEDLRGGEPGLSDRCLSTTSCSRKSS